MFICPAVERNHFLQPQIHFRRCVKENKTVTVLCFSVCRGFVESNHNLKTSRFYRTDMQIKTIPLSAKIKPLHTVHAYLHICIFSKVITALGLSCCKKRGNIFWRAIFDQYFCPPSKYRPNIAFAARR